MLILRIFSALTFLFIGIEAALASGAPTECKATDLTTDAKPMPINMSGSLVYRTLNGGPYYADGWTVEGRWVLDNGEIQLAMGRHTAQTTTQDDGSWCLPLLLLSDSDIPTDRLPVQLKLIFSPQNDFVIIGDKAGTPHEFEHYISAPSFSVKLSEAIELDLSTTSKEFHMVAGVGDVFDATIQFFDTVKKFSGTEDFLFSDLKILKKRRIRIYYPNTWYDCYHGDGKPYSCADDQARSEIWIARDDVVERPHKKTYNEVKDNKLRDEARDRVSMTVMHELAHELNSRKWNYKWPKSDNETIPRCPDIDSDKKLTEPHKALTEGFATALAALVQYGIPPGRKVMAFEYNLERPARTECDKLAGAGAMQAIWVAAAFWDMIDVDNSQDEYQDPATNRRTSDSWSFPDPFEPFRIYLQDWTAITVQGCPERGTISDIRDCRFLSHLRDASGGEVDIDAILQHNNILP